MVLESVLCVHCLMEERGLKQWTETAPNDLLELLSPQRPLKAPLHHRLAAKCSLITYAILMIPSLK